MANFNSFTICCGQDLSSAVVLIQSECRLPAKFGVVSLVPPCLYRALQYTMHVRKATCPSTSSHDRVAAGCRLERFMAPLFAGELSSVALDNKHFVSSF